MALDTSPDLLAALKEITEGRGAYSQDQLTHAENTIEHMKEVARAAIAAHKDAHRDGADDLCPCYREAWQAGYEAERRH